jgi:hypothetical protein
MKNNCVAVELALYHGIRNLRKLIF